MASHMFGAPKPPKKSESDAPPEDQYTKIKVAPTPYADLFSGFNPEQERAEEEARVRGIWLAERLKRDSTGEALRTYGAEIAVRMTATLADAWARRMLPYRSSTPSATTETIRKALNVEAYAFKKDGAALETFQGVREFSPAEYHTLTSHEVEQEDLTAKALPRTTERIALLARVAVETKENLRVASIFDRCCDQTGQVVTAHCLTAKSFFDAISFVERTGAATSFITVHREDAESFVSDLEGFRSESDRLRRGLGFIGKFDGIDVVTSTTVVPNVVKRGCAYVTVAPNAIGAVEEKLPYTFNPFPQLLEHEVGKEGDKKEETAPKKSLGWTVDGEHRLYVTNPYGVARINFAKASQRRM